MLTMTEKQQQAVTALEVARREGVTVTAYAAVARSSAPIPIAHTPSFTSPPLISNQGKTLVTASGLVTGKGMQLSPAKMRQKPGSLRTLFMPPKYLRV